MPTSVWDSEPCLKLGTALSALSTPLGHWNNWMEMVKLWLESEQKLLCSVYTDSGRYEKWKWGRAWLTGLELDFNPACWYPKFYIFNNIKFQAPDQPPHGLHGSRPYQLLGIWLGTCPILCSEALIQYNFRPVSNLSFMSKIVEKVVAKQLTEYLDCNNLPKLQSGFRRFHSTETAVLKVLSDVYTAIDQGQVALLALLDVSAAFDTVDHTILLDRLSISYGISGTAHAWISSFVCGRSQTVHFGGTTSSPSKVRYGIPQGSTLGPLLYVLYTADVAKLVEKLGFKVHLYADDTQLYGYSSSSGSVTLAMNILSCHRLSQVLDVF